MDKLNEAIEAGRIRRTEDGSYQVHAGDAWITCETDEEALALDATPSLRRRWQRRHGDADTTVEELEVTVRACEKYGLNSMAYRSLKAWIKEKQQAPTV